MSKRNFSLTLAALACMASACGDVDGSAWQDGSEEEALGTSEEELAFCPAQTICENFDGPGADWSTTHFSALIPSGGGAFERGPVAPGLGAPLTAPPVPINEGGDKEGRYYEATLAPSGSYAIMADLPENHIQNASIRGFFSIGHPAPFGTQSASFLLRAAGDVGVPVNAYGALFQRSGSGGVLSITRTRDGIIQASDFLAISSSFAVDFSTENILVDFRAFGSTLSTRAWITSVQNGVVVISPISLAPGSPTPTVMTASDTELVEGRPGLGAFARGGNSVFFDDVRIRLQ